MGILLTIARKRGDVQSCGPRKAVPESEKTALARRPIVADNGRVGHMKGPCPERFR